MSELVEAQRQFVQTANRLPTLFDLSDQEVAILALIEDAESADEEPIDGLENQLALVEAALANKVEGYVSIIRTLQSLRDERKRQADRLRRRAQTADRAAEWLLARLKTYLEGTPQQRVETGLWSVSLRANPPRVEILEPMMVPARFKEIRTEEHIDKRAILAEVKATGEIPSGCEVVRDRRVQIA